jgi:hypothetical protein
MQTLNGNVTATIKYDKNTNAAEQSSEPDSLPFFLEKMFAYIKLSHFKVKILLATYSSPLLLLIVFCLSNLISIIYNSILNFKTNIISNNY